MDSFISWLSREREKKEKQVKEKEKELEEGKTILSVFILFWNFNN